MFANSLDKKPLYTRPDGMVVKDLTTSMFNVKTGNYISYEVYKVPREFEMRPDLISAAVYNTSEYAELILKFNSISNPFTIKEGDIILIPNLNSVKAALNTKSGEIVDTGKELRNSYKYIDPVKIPKSDNTFYNRQIVAAPEGALPPNFSKEGVPQVTYRNGRVYFGEDVGTCLQNGMTQSEFLTTIIKSKKV